MHDFLEVVFADELNAFRAFTLSTLNENLRKATRACQTELHAWRRANRVEFDPKKESTHVVSHRCPERRNFKLLVVNFDCRLTMNDAIIDLVCEMRCRVKAVMRAQGFNSHLVWLTCIKRRCFHTLNAELRRFIMRAARRYLRWTSSNKTSWQRQEYHARTR